MKQSVAILMPGDMGHGVGQALVAEGHDVLSPLANRSEHTKALAKRAGIKDAGDIASAVAAADIILSILPPDQAEPQARSVAQSMQDTGRKPVFVDCNAISPMTTGKVAAVIEQAGARMIDCGIIGLNPIKAPPTRFFVSGPNCDAILDLACQAIRVEQIGDGIGQASALKMVYAALTKGTWTLQTAVLMAAKQLDVLEPLLSEFAYSQSGPLKDMRTRTPFLPADAERWVPEMEEIASTFASAKVTPHFHKGAAEIFRVLAQSAFAGETRETLDKTRSLETALQDYVKRL